MVKKWGSEIEKSFDSYFIQLFLYYILFDENFVFFKLKLLYIQYAWISVMKKQNSNQNGKIENLVVLVKTFDHYLLKFQLFQPPCKIVTEFETEI